MKRFAVFAMCAAGFVCGTPAFAQDSFGAAPPVSQHPSTTPGPAPSQTQPTGPAPYQPPAGYGAPTQQSGAPSPDPYTQEERQDYGVPATAQLHTGAMHGPTPASIHGGQIITTQGVAELVQSRQVPFLLLDILGGPETLPGAAMAVPAHLPGSFNDQTQAKFAEFLQKSTEGNKQMPIVLYCQSTYCWMSYNAALRAINMGYTNVLWYRGGLEAWQKAGLQTQRIQSFNR